MNDQLAISRRGLLQGGAVIVGFALRPAFKSFAQDALETKSVARNEVDSFLSIDTQGHATIYSGKVDLGTGARKILRRSRLKNSTCR
jgi:nicotinate dehydrogenase subunit B